MNTRSLGLGSGLLRLGVGATLLLTRRPSARLLFGETGAVGPALLAWFGARDMTLGVSALLATGRGGDVRRQIRLQALADLLDAATLGAVAATGRIARDRAVGAGAVAVVSAAAEAAVAARI